MSTEPSLQSTVLPCGLAVNQVALPYGKSFWATLCLRAGSHNDPLALSGVAHFTEHMAFAGVNRKIAEQLSEEGVYLNGSTADECTVFEAQGHVDYLDSTLHFFANILKKARTCEATFFREREVIRQEIKDHEPENLHKRTLGINRYRAKLARDPNWKRTSCGDIKVLSKIKPEHIDRFREENYHTQNVVMSVIASSSKKELTKKTENTFESVVASSSAVHETKIDKRNNLPIFTYSYDASSTLWISVDYSISRCDTAARSAADILSHHFGGGSHSEMFKKFRQDTVNAYNATSRFDSWLDHMALNSFVSTTKKHLPDALDFLLNRMMDIRDKGPTQEQLDAHVARYGRWSQTVMDQPLRLVYYLGYESLRPQEDRLVDPVQVAKTTCSLSLEEVREATREILARRIAPFL